MENRDSSQTSGARYALGLAVAAAIVAIAAAQARQQPIPDTDTRSDPVIAAARRAAADFGKSSPDYIVKRTTARYQGERPDGPVCFDRGPDPRAAPATPPAPFSKFRWRTLDVV